MDIKEIYKAHCNDFCSFTGFDTKYEWAASEVFDIHTYDGSLDELIVKKIIEVCKVIFDKRTYEYIEDKNNYISYILVCNLLDKFNWITWGTSIRGAWFYACEDSDRILDCNLEWYGLKEIKFTEENLRALIEFMEAK